MPKTLKIEVHDHNPLKALRGFFKILLEQEDISALLAPCRIPTQTMVTPMLISAGDRVNRIDPLAPAFPMNAAKMASRLTRKPSGGRFAALMRPCEIRAFIELVKLKQGRAEDLVLIGIDCLGAFGNRDYQKWAQENSDDLSRQYAQEVLSGKKTGTEKIELAQACQACEFPVSEGADINIGLFGMDTDREILIQSLSDKGAHLLDALDLPAAEIPAARSKDIEGRISQNIAFRDQLLTQMDEQINSQEKLGTFLSSCVNCYNCRVACPVCYCRECVFVTDVFDHEPSQYLNWAQRSGAVKMPTDTMLYHITRLVHMSTACVGCGQCTNACPNDIPVMALFRTVAHRTQTAFDYQAGRSLTENPPMSEFKEEEFEEIVGIN
jgi:formate dehydrogenase subunit beta